MPTLGELPSKKDNEEEDEAQLGEFPWYAIFSFFIFVLGTDCICLGQVRTSFQV